MDGFDDAEIALAIARSLQEAAPAPKTSQHAEVIEILDDDEPQGGVADDQFEADLKRAIAASQAPAASAPGSTTQQGTVSASSSVASTTPPAPTRPGSAFLFDRAQLERERLARQARLRPEIAEVSSSGSSKHARDDDEDEERETGAKKSRTASPARPQDASGMFYEGELRQTANMRVDPAKDTRPVFRLTDILAPRDDIAFAVVSAYVLNLPWLYTFFNRETPVVVVTQDPAGHETIKEVLPNWIKTTPFLRNGRGCQHMKFMLLFYKSGRLRVVVSTANLVEYDWRDVENSVWVQDVPLRSSPIPHDRRANDFPAAFMRVLHAVNVAPALISLKKIGFDKLPLSRIEDLRAKWDFSKVKVALIPSIAGRHEGWPEVIQTGHTALMKALQDLGARTPKGKEVVLECQGSSIGSYTTLWLNEFYVSARGESAESWLDTPRARRARAPFPPVKILFPSRATVRASVLGEPGGGTMFCRRSQWQAANFPRELFYDSNSLRGRVLMHSKMILATFRDGALAGRAGPSRRQDTPSTDASDEDIVEVAPPAPKEALVGWAYVGSHNFTPSAWGTLSGSAFNPVLNITNYELGVLIPLRTQAEADRIACWERPPRKYMLGQDEPWMQEESAYFSETGQD